jgi:hypothetical protein
MKFTHNVSGRCGDGPVVYFLPACLISMAILAMEVYV